MPTVTKNASPLAVFDKPVKTASSKEKPSAFAQALQERTPKAAADTKQTAQTDDGDAESGKTMTESKLGSAFSLSDLLSRAVTEHRDRTREPAEGATSAFDEELAPATKLAFKRPADATLNEDAGAPGKDSSLVESKPGSVKETAQTDPAAEQQPDPAQGKDEPDTALSPPAMITSPEMPGLRILVREARRDADADSKGRISLSATLNASNKGFQADPTERLSMPGKSDDVVSMPGTSLLTSRQTPRNNTFTPQQAMRKDEPSTGNSIKVDVVSTQSIPAPQRLGDTASGLLQQLSTQLTRPTQTAEAIQQIQHAQQNVSSATHMLKVNLNPAELGSVVASLHLTGSQLRVAIQTDTIEAYRQLTVDSDALVKALQSMGYDVDGVSVQPPQAMQASQGRADAAQANQADFSNRSDAQFASQQGRPDGQSHQESSRRSPNEAGTGQRNDTVDPAGIGLSSERYI